MTTKSSYIIEALKLIPEAIAALWEILRSPRLIISVLPQYIVGLGSGYLIYHFISLSLTPLLASYLSFELTNWPQFIASSINWVSGGVAKIISIVIAGIASVIGGYLSIFILAGFFVEIFIEQIFRARQLKPRHAPSLFGALIRTIKDETAKLFILGSLSIIALITAFIPAVTPISIILGALIIGFELFDQPLILLGFKFRERLKMSARHILTIVGLGALFSLTTIIPFLPILLLPVGSLTAIRIFQSWPEVKALQNQTIPKAPH